MPKELEQKLKHQVSGKNWSQEKKDAYVYGTLRKTGWKPEHSPVKFKRREGTIGDTY